MPQDGRRYYVSNTSKLRETPIAIRYFLQQLTYDWPPAVLPLTPPFTGDGTDDRID